MRWVRALKTWLGRLDRDIGRKIAGDKTLETAVADSRQNVARTMLLKAGDEHVLYAFHPPRSDTSPRGKRDQILVRR